MPSLKGVGRYIFFFRFQVGGVQVKVFGHILRANPKFNPTTLVDIGANKGHVVAHFARRFPDARIFALEPAQSTFDLLKTKFAQNEKISLHCLALDLEPRSAHFTNLPGSTGNTLTEKPGQRTNQIEVTTGDLFCRSQKIGSIDFLKIDTEGFDLRVLAGFTEILRFRKVRFLQVECTTTLDNHFHVHLERFIHFLHPYGYRLFGLFEPVRKCYQTKQRLNGIWFCNAVFAAEVANPRLRTDGVN